MEIKEHKWAAYYNPRNGKVRINACSRCGTAKDFVTSLMHCEGNTASQQEHRITKMGWKELHRTAGHRVNLHG